MNAARLLLLLELTSHAGRREEKPVLSGLQLAPELDKFCCGVLLSVSLCPSHSISPTPPSHPCALLLLLLLPPPPPALPPIGGEVPGRPVCDVRLKKILIINHVYGP